MRLSRLIGLLVVVASGGGALCQGQTPNAQASSRPRMSGIPKSLMPLDPDAPREIRNPYFAKPAWKLWAKDPTPVTIDRPPFQATVEVIPKAKRRYPSFPPSWRSGAPPLIVRHDAKVAGSWDDAYLSLDNDHTRLRVPRGQFILAGKMRSGLDWRTRFELGVNFTSQSYAGRGRHIVDDTFNNLRTEKYFFFANCVRCTPAHISYRDVDPERTSDLYDGLFGHSYHSVGQSGSEMHAIYKMMTAGACLSRETKDLLKRHGAYAPVLLTLFKAALPYTDAQGRDLPYENEMRHRPAYSSHGTPSHPHYCAADIPYHGYDDDLHIRRMVELARHMEIAPPVAVLRIPAISATKGDQTVRGADAAKGRLKSLGLTHVNLYAQPGETLRVVVDLSSSYDLQGKPLTFAGQAVYPNHTNVTVTDRGKGVFFVEARPDPKLPKGRVPVVFVARNGGDVPSNPVFLNVYWAGEGDVSDYRSRDRNVGKRPPVNDNRRPTFEPDLPGESIRCAPGGTVRVPLRASDPEGFPVTFYGRSGEVGAVEGDAFVWHVPQGERPGLRTVHLVASDGTGMYAGRRLRLLVSGKDDKLPDGWHATTFGREGAVDRVDADGMRLTFSGTKADPKRGGNEPPGYFAFTRSGRPVDIETKLSGEPGAYAGLMVRDGAGDYAPRAWIARCGDEIRMAFQTSRTARWPQVFHYPLDAGTDAPAYLRLIVRDGEAAGYISSDGKDWQQVFCKAMTFGETPMVGVFHCGSVGGKVKPVACEWLEPTGPALPILTHAKARTHSRTHKFLAPMDVSVVPGVPGATVHYTLDGSAPTADSPECDKPIPLAEAGDHTLRVATFVDGKPAGAVRAVYRVQEKAK